MKNNKFVIGKWFTGVVTPILAGKKKAFITRRHFLKSLSLGTATIVLWSRLLLSATESGDYSPREFRWRVPIAHFETVKKELRFEGEIAEEKDAKGLPLIFIFVGAVLIPYLAKAILAIRREIVYGGVLIDTRGDKIEIDTDKSLSSGVIVIVTPDGAQLYERDEIENPTEMVEVLTKLKTK